MSDHKLKKIKPLCPCNVFFHYDLIHILNMLSMYSFFLLLLNVSQLVFAGYLRTDELNWVQNHDIDLVNGDGF